MIPAVYRTLLRDRRTRRLLAGLGVSSLGDGMSTVTIAWLAVKVAPPGALGVYVGLALAAYTLPGVIGALAFSPFVRQRPARALVLVHCVLRAGFLGAIALLWSLGALAPLAYVFLLAGSSLMFAWGNAGEYTMLSELGGPDGRLAVNSLATAQVSFAVIIGPAIAGPLIAGVGPGWLVAVDAASFAFLGIQAWRTHAAASATRQPVDTSAAESGFRLLLRRRDLLALTAVTWLFFFLYGPVEAALPVYVAHDLRADATLLGAYWAAFGVGALAATLIAGTFRGHNVRRITLWIVAGWGACLIPFGFAPVGVTAGVFRARRFDLRAVCPAHVLAVPVGDHHREPAGRSGRSKRAGDARVATGHRDRGSVGRRPRRVTHSGRVGDRHRRARHRGELRVDEGSRRSPRPIRRRTPAP